MGTRNFFGEGSPYLNHPLLTAERTARDVELILVQLELSPGARVLDVGCGPGRHTVELARRGYEVLGIDPSRAMIEAARARAAASDVAPDFRQVGGESFRAEREFDAAICLFTTLGQISEQGENSGLVPRVYDALCPGGYFVVETPQREWVVRHLERAERLGAGERYTDVTRQYDAKAKTVTEVFKVVSPQVTESYLLRYRLYSRTELSGLLEGAGFTIVASFGNYEGDPLGPDSAVMLLVGRR
jgi:2-polyprenyl-3-methyl-5-hydroxy-6-metoxy-1,4-benzoquinol methylase